MDKQLKSEEYQGYNIDFYKTRNNQGNVVVYATVRQTNRWDTKDLQLFKTPLRYPSKGAAFDDIKKFLDEEEFRKKINEKLYAERKKIDDVERAKYAAYEKELRDFMNSYSKPLGFTFRDTSFGMSHIDFYYEPKLIEVEQFGTYMTVDAETGKVSRIHFQMPKGINYNGFGEQDLKDINLKNVKFLSTEYMLFLQNAAKLGTLVVKLSLKEKIEALRQKHYPKKK